MPFPYPLSLSCIKMGVFLRKCLTPLISLLITIEPLPIFFPGYYTLPSHARYSHLSFPPLSHKQPGRNKRQAKRFTEKTWHKETLK